MWVKVSALSALAMTSFALAQAITNSANGYVTNIDKTTIENEDFRRVLFTGAHSQLVVMSLKPNEEIGQETHQVDQFFRIESGRALLKMGNKEYSLGKDSAFIVPAGVKHNIKNIGRDQLKVYTIYSPAQHPAGTVHHTKADASSAAD
jgi:mannose-6-phosphate isomerase-like protein (cupin superfamily)